jgi:hypothetical protein
VGVGLRGSLSTGVAGAVVAALLLLVGCGGDDGDGESSPSVTERDDTSATASTEAADSSAPDDSEGSGGASDDRCPLTEDEVSEVLAATVVDEGACTFFPPEDLLPSAGFVLQLAFACDGDFPAEVGYEEPLEGLGVDAYVQRETVFGTQILVCEDRPFEVYADMPGDSEADFAAAEQLARLVLEG